MKSIILMLLISTSVLGQIRYTTIDGSVVGEAGNLVLDLTQLRLDSDTLVDRELILKRYRRRVRYKKFAIISSSVVAAYSALWIYDEATVPEGEWGSFVPVNAISFLSNAITLTNLHIRSRRVKAYYKKHIAVIE